MDKWEYQNKPCYLENRVVREPCKRRTACIRWESHLLGSCGVWNMIVHNWLNFSDFCMCGHQRVVTSSWRSCSSRFSADWLIFRESAHCVVLHCALLHLLTISSLLDDHAADTTVLCRAAQPPASSLEPIFPWKIGRSTGRLVGGAIAAWWSVA